MPTKKYKQLKVRGKITASQLLRIDQLAKAPLGGVAPHWQWGCQGTLGGRGLGVSHRMFKIIRPVLALIAVAAMLSLILAPEAASAQSWWPFGGNDEPERAPVPQEPVYRQNAPPPPPPAGIPPGAPQGAMPPPPPGQVGPAPQAKSNWSAKNPICYQLEQRLLQDSQKNSQSRDALPRIENDMRTVDRTYNLGQSQLDRSCYDSFLFVKTFRNTAQCKDLAKQVEVSRRRLADLEAQRQDIINTGGRSYKDDIVRELARNNCGANYVDMARKTDRNGESGIWQDEEQGAGNSWSSSAANGAQTYRTVCVRLCDGYFFPVSFSTLPSHFSQDAEACSSKCAAPAELYYYPNPGGSIEQSLALNSQEAYSKLKVAFRYRKEYVNGCSCKAAEYTPPADAAAGKKADAAKSSSYSQRRAEGPATNSITTGSTSVPAQNGGWETQEAPATDAAAAPGQ